ncbi:serine protease, partial [Kocuria arenosa]|uniref:trypsin-like serine peptidase n=1 Tax=Kocuria arenosa TaxID=3071446 RepID=UPI0034D4B454
MSTPSGDLGPDNTAGDGGPGDALADELQYQQDLALQRVRQREQQRLATQEKLGHPEGLVQANDPLRVAKRLDRVTRYLTGGNPMESPAAAPAAALVGSAAQRLGAPAASAVESVGVQETLLERVINTADFVDVRYLEAGVTAQRCVGRVNIRDDRGSVQGYGTGFLVSPHLLLTNHHVLPDPATARTSIIEFDYQDGIDGKPLPPTVFSLDPDRFFAADRDLDFALVAVAAEPAVLARYGFCPLTAAQGTVIIGEFVTIVQHPRGEKKQLALRENTLIDIPELVLHYSADTEPGSSGSPVFNDQWEVVALHHASIATPQHAPQYRFLNEGIRISRILHHLMQLPLTAEQAALLAQLTTAKPATTTHTGHTPDATAGDSNTAAAAPPLTPVTPPPETTPATPPASAATTDGAVAVEIPLRITVQLGAPAAAPTLASPARPGLPGTATTEPPATGGQAVEAISID